MPIESNNKSCKHRNFRVVAEVQRLVDEEGDEQIVKGYNVDVIIHCVECNLPFHFVGPYKAGASPNEVRVSPDRLELRAPIAPGEGQFIRGCSYESLQ